MAKLENMSLDELYSRKITASVENAIMMKEDFSHKSDRWCEKVCRLNCKNPPRQDMLLPSQHRDILIIQDYKAFDEPRFKRKAADVEEKHREIIHHIAREAFRAKPGFPELSFSVTELLKCRVTAPDIKKGKAPGDIVLSKCRPYVLKEIELRKPKVVISLNTSVTKALGFKKTNYGNRGEIFNNTVFTIHPRTLLMLRQNSSGKFWGPDFYEIIKRDFMKAAGLARGELHNPDLPAAVEKYRKHVRVARSIEDVRSFCNELKAASVNGGILSYDTETNSLDPYAVDAKIITMQFGYRTEEGYVKALVFPMWHKKNNFYNPDEAWVYFIRSILNDANIPKVGHNIKFDVLFTYTTTGCRIQGVVFDTMLLLHAKDSGTQGVLGLKQAVWDYLPEMELGGYEDLLPPLTSKRNLEKLENENETEDGSEHDDGAD